MKSKKTLLIITTAFPYGAGEAFLETEFPYLTQGFNNVIIFTTGIGFEKGASIDPNIEVHKFIVLKYSHFFSVFCSLDFWLDIYYYLISRSSKKSLKGIKYIFTFFRSAYIKKKQIKELLVMKNLYDSENLIICSYWMTDDALAVALLKKERIAIAGVTKAHRYDLYEGKNQFCFLAARKVIKTNLDKLIFISNSGKLHFTEKHGKSNKYVVSRLGVKQQYLKEWHPKSVLNIVSCSYIHPVKRIGLIIKSLANINQEFKIKWTHIGSAMDSKVWDDTIEQAKIVFKNGNIDYNFVGYLPNVEVTEFYQNSEIDVLINLSASEGIPVTMMEAMSFGIPIIATDVGGVSEIVIDGYNGYLLNENSSVKDIALKIEAFISLDPAKIRKMRRNAYDTWSLSFNAEKNYTSFVKELTNENEK